MPLTELRLRAVRAQIAEVASTSLATSALGDVRLRPHQQLGVARVTQMMERHGGCLLADEVGHGKTFVALAVARRWARPLVVVPASLRSTWQRAMDRTGVACAMISHEALSRGTSPALEPDGVIVDESHHFRSPSARRHAALATITAHAPILLLSATPLQNRTRDLAAQLAFFLGNRAFRKSEAALAQFVVRSAERDDAELPCIAPPEWLHSGHDDGAVLRAVLALPAPARPFDAGDAGALRTIGLVRAWASSRATLLGVLRQRTRIVTALEQCAASGLAPSRRDLRAWQGMDNDVQLALAPLLVPRTIGGPNDAFLATINAERRGLDRLRQVLAGSTDPDLARAAALRRLRDEHPGTRIIAFSEFATTVRAYFSLLHADHEIGMLTAKEARIASGRLSRDALLARFAPTAQGARDPVPRERVSLLLTTDLLSEGVNLQDASIVVHLDLPWNPARLAQRLGRVRRPGSASVVHSYLMSPPASTELLLRVDARLRAKLARAERTIGRLLDVMPPLHASAPELAARAGATGLEEAAAGADAEQLGDIATRVSRWRRARTRRTARPSTTPLVAAARSTESGWLAALDDGRLLARIDSSPAKAGSTTLRAVTLASAPARAVGASERARALADIADRLERERLAIDCGVRDDASPLDAAIERRIARALVRVPRHERAHLLGMAERLRAAFGPPRPLGAERELERLLAAHTRHDLTDAEWLERSFAVTASVAPRRRWEASHVVALILLGASSR